MIIDLHGVKHAEVQRRLDVFFWECIQKNLTSARVITGLSTKMKKIVIDVSDEYGFTIVENPVNFGEVYVYL